MNIEKRKCPLCKTDRPDKVIYFGFPVLLCQDIECNCMFGFWSNITQYLPYNGYLLSYESSYWNALKHFLGW